MAGGRDNAVPGHGHSNNQTHGGQSTPLRINPITTTSKYSTTVYIPRGFIKPQPSVAYAASGSGTDKRGQTYGSEHPSYTAKTATAMRRDSSSQRYNYNYGEKDLNAKPRPFSSRQPPRQFETDF
ncbi:hypothetical protein BSL78_14895 [Apostichopus japonicus]|uniref:Uncharacterized protein n=1 Tax=Stichopus japonicus TaxID=307972 RepID=A0A2G8KJR6_STIJA|nr:hypothetical protein BSL78_14895 [Apostichopus japonicus]